ncbi:MAG: GIY-YIG nuclease family protein [Dehalococcoidia bacterium]
MNSRGSYLLLLYLDAGTRIAIGKLGRADFPAGYYLYAGSALGGLSPRINRHFRKEKKLHWHIDYLLFHAQILEVWGVYSNERVECHLARAALDLTGAAVPAAGFGSSDCRCRTHLVYLPDKPELATFQAIIGERVSLELLSSPDAL